jgi:hypothetical protein
MFKNSLKLLITTLVLTFGFATSAYSILINCTITTDRGIIVCYNTVTGRDYIIN